MLPRRTRKTVGGGPLTEPSKTRRPALPQVSRYRLARYGRWPSLNGLCVLKEMVQVLPNEPSDNPGGRLFGSEGEAEAAATSIDRDRRRRPNLRNVVIPTATPALVDRIGIYQAGPDATENVVAAWALQRLPGLVGAGIDGMWWRSPFDPDNGKGAARRHFRRMRRPVELRQNRSRGDQRRRIPRQHAGYQDLGGRVVADPHGLRVVSE